MKATTIKVEGELLEELERTKPPRQSLSAYVRALLQQAVVRRRMIDAADRYAEFVRDTPEGRTWLAEWDSADLVTQPKRRRRGGAEASTGSTSSPHHRRSWGRSGQGSWFRIRRRTSGSTPWSSCRSRPGRRRSGPCD